MLAPKIGRRPSSSSNCARQGAGGASKSRRNQKTGSERNIDSAGLIFGNGSRRRREKVEEKKIDRWNAIEEILRIIERLRSETGCPWDRKQTPETIQTYLVEESHEAAAAVRAGKVEEVAEELGDVLFMVFFLVYLYEQRGDFTLEEVCRRSVKK